MQILFLLLVSFFTIDASIRGYSTVWRNAQNKIVKQAIYTPTTRFKPHFETELDELQKLGYGWEYIVHELQGADQHGIRKVLVRKNRRLDD